MGRIDAVESDGAHITSVTLSDGSSLKADLFVDCSGPARTLIGRLGSAFKTNRSVLAAHSSMSPDQLGAPCRTVTAHGFGWQAQTPLQQALDILTISAPGDAEAAHQRHNSPPTRQCEAALGALEAAWIGNCVAVGTSACVMDPLTPAPLMLLERDIARLLDLMAHPDDLGIEPQEYNRRFQDDVTHADIFHQALFQGSKLPSGAYWQAVAHEPVSERLHRKLTQFDSRGIFVAYDLEPFHEEDWAILFNGMGRKPRRYDRQADRPDAQPAAQTLIAIKQAIAQLVHKMPPHHAYMAGLKRYLKEKGHG